MYLSTLQNCIVLHYVTKINYYYFFTTWKLLKSSLFTRSAVNRKRMLYYSEEISLCFSLVWAVTTGALLSVINRHGTLFLTKIHWTIRSSFLNKMYAYIHAYNYFFECLWIVTYEYFIIKQFLITLKEHLI